MQSAPPTRDPNVLTLTPKSTEPIQVWYAAVLTADGPITSIARRWPPGTGWCRRCPIEKCNAEGGVCLLVVRRLVPEAAAADFGLSALDGPEPLDRHVLAGPGVRGFASHVLTPAHGNL